MTLNLKNVAIRFALIVVMTKFSINQKNLEAPLESKLNIGCILGGRNLHHERVFSSAKGVFLCGGMQIMAGYIFYKGKSSNSNPPRLQPECDEAVRIIMFNANEQE